MNLEGILYVSGKPGLFKVVSNTKNTVIIESLTDKRRRPIHSQTQANMLEEIGIYTYNDTKSISDIFDKIAEKENGDKTISHKSSENELTSYFREILNDYDEEKVYLSDIKKVFQWYNTIHNAGLINMPKKKNNKKKNSKPNSIKK
tara:strand:+ start:102 stop:539 length:438 start_codon:yes stop_codon:yes gene_type:complete